MLMSIKLPRFDLVQQCVCERARIFQQARARARNGGPRQEATSARISTSRLWAAAIVFLSTIVRWTANRTSTEEVSLMALMTPEQFEASLKDLKPRVFMNGKRVPDVLVNRNTRTVVEANKASYAWALDPKYRDTMTCFSPLVNEVVNRYTHVSPSTDDLVRKA